MKVQWQVTHPQLRVISDDFDPKRTVDLQLDGFLNQRVLALQDAWVTRRQVIKYVANIGSGVHSGEPKEAEDRLLARIRGALTYTHKDGGTAMTFNAPLFADIIDFSHSPDAIDPVLIEIFAAAYFLMNSPDILKLEESIRGELSSIQTPNV